MVPSPREVSAGAATRNIGSIGGSSATIANGSGCGTAVLLGVRATGERPPLARFFGVRAGSDLLVRSIEDKSPAANAGLDAADIIVTANGMPLETTADWLQTLRINAGHAVALTVRNRKVLTPAITIYTRITQSELVIPEQLQKLRESLDRYSL